MKSTGPFPLLLLALLPLSAPRAQAPTPMATPVTALASLDIAIWPDYDRPSVLVMFTGALAAESALPAVVTVPLPAGAQLNAVARIDGQSRMLADIAYTADAGELTLTTTDPHFQVEYYVPYRIESGEHAFAFTWLSELAVEQIRVTVQQPASATSMLTEPAASEFLSGKEGLTYHRLPVQAVPAGQPLSVWLRYPMATTRLSADTLASSASTPTGAAAVAPEPPPPAPASDPSSDYGWWIVLVVVAAGLLSAAVVRRIALSRSAPLAASVESGRESQARRFCQSCGRPVAHNDRFCIDCGAELSQ